MRRGSRGGFGATAAPERVLRVPAEDIRVRDLPNQVNPGGCRQVYRCKALADPLGAHAGRDRGSDDPDDDKWASVGVS